MSKSSTLGATSEFSVLLIPFDLAQEMTRSSIEKGDLQAFARVIPYRRDTTIQGRVPGGTPNRLERNPRATRLLAASLKPGEWLGGLAVILSVNPSTGECSDLPAGFEDTIDLTSGLPNPTGERHAPRAITYEWSVSSDTGAEGLVVLRITGKSAGLDIDEGRCLPSRYEAELANHIWVPSPNDGSVGEIPFTGLRICWEQTPRFSETGMEAFAGVALERLRGLYLAGDTRLSPYFYNSEGRIGSVRRRLRCLHELLARRAYTDWGRSYVEEDLARDPDAPGAWCPRFAGIVEESGDEAVLLAETEAQLAADMADLLNSEIPIRPVELVDLDTERHRAAVYEATVRFAPLSADATPAALTRS
ncbi:MAG: hypothetical protein ABSH36_02605 [Solirubrobacteraceae bacterium]